MNPFLVNNNVSEGTFNKFLVKNSIFLVVNSYNYIRDWNPELIFISVPCESDVYGSKPRHRSSNIVILQMGINNDLLKRALYKLAASPEAHLSIRSEFVKCHATIGYPIGIEDRHLENFLIDMTK